MRLPGWIERVAVAGSLDRLSGLVHPATPQIEDVFLGSQHGDGFDHFSGRRTDLRQHRQTAALLTSVAEHLSVEDLLTLIESVRTLVCRARRPLDPIRIDVNWCHWLLPITAESDRIPAVNRRASHPDRARRPALRGNAAPQRPLGVGHRFARAAPLHAAFAAPPQASQPSPLDAPYRQRRGV